MQVSGRSQRDQLDFHGQSCRGSAFNPPPSRLCSSSSPSHQPSSSNAPHTLVTRLFLAATFLSQAAWRLRPRRRLSLRASPLRRGRHLRRLRRLRRLRHLRRLRRLRRRRRRRRADIGCSCDGGHSGGACDEAPDRWEGCRAVSPLGELEGGEALEALRQARPVLEQYLQDLLVLGHGRDRDRLLPRVCLVRRRAHAGGTFAQLYHAAKQGRQLPRKVCLQARAALDELAHDFGVAGRDRSEERRPPEAGQERGVHALLVAHRMSGAHPKQCTPGAV
eukprot:scaffold224_cov71-Phaeocystis_antarctica.AAC.5